MILEQYIKYQGLVLGWPSRTITAAVSITPKHLLNQRVQKMGLPPKLSFITSKKNELWEAWCELVVISESRDLTILEWIIVNLKSQDAIEVYEACINRGRRVLKQPASVSTSIDSLFSWGLTRFGHSYWDNLRNKMRTCFITIHTSQIS